MLWTCWFDRCLGLVCKLFWLMVKSCEARDMPLIPIFWHLSQGHRCPCLQLRRACGRDSVTNVTDTANSKMLAMQSKLVSSSSQTLPLFSVVSECPLISSVAGRHCFGTCQHCRSPRRHLSHVTGSFLTGRSFSSSDGDANLDWRALGPRGGASLSWISHCA